MGPLGKAEGLDDQRAQRKLEAVSRIVPYVKLLLTQKLHVPDRTEEAYRSVLHQRRVRQTV